MRNLLLSLLIVGSGRAAEEATADLAAAGPPHRYLVLVETSREMRRQYEVAVDTVNKLLLNGFNGRIRANDTVALWTYSDTVERNRIPARLWVPAQGVDVANQAFRLLQEVKLAKSPNMVEAVEAMKDEVVKPGVLTAILVSSGSAPLEGTPVDRLVNDITGRNLEGMQQAGRPFVIAFVTKDGKFLNHAVSPGGRPIYIPPLPKPPPPKPAATNQATAVVAATNKPRPMSVAEIEAALRKTAQATNVTAAPPTRTSLLPTNTPAEAPPSGRTIKPAPTVPVSNAAPSVVAPTESVSPASPLEEEPNSTTTTAPVTEPPPAVAASSAATSGSFAPKPVRDEPVAAPAGPTDAPTADARRDRAIESPTGPPSPVVSDLATSQPHVRLPPEPVVPTPVAVAGSWVDLATGCAFLLAALALGWVLIRNVRSKAGASLISQSLDQEKK